MNMVKLTVCAVLQWGLLCVGYVFADAGKVITDEDLKGYRSTADFEVQKDKKSTGSGTKQKAAVNPGIGKDQEHYCKKGTEYRRNIDEARLDVEQAKKKLNELKGASNIKMSRVMRAEDNLAKKEKDLIHAERDLIEFENEAHRKDIPPGWIRCQF